MMTVIDTKPATGAERPAAGHVGLPGLFGDAWARLRARRGPSSDSLAALLPFTEGDAAIQELRLGHRGQEWTRAHAAGMVSRLVVERGRLEVAVGGEHYQLAEGDIFHLAADRPHHYRNTGRGEAVAYAVTTYGNPPNRA